MERDLSTDKTPPVAVGSKVQRQPRGRPYSGGQGQGVGVDYRDDGMPHKEVEEPEQVYSELTPDGKKEIPDSVPMEPPLGYSSSPSLAEYVQRHIHQTVQAMSELAHQDEFESEEEANDFDIEDDPIDQLTPYEAVFLPQPPRPAPTSSEGRGAGEGGEQVASQTQPPAQPPAPAQSNPNDKA
jgi:hypothetical protein